MSIKTWSDKQEQRLIEMYTEEDIRDVHELARYFKKGYRSVISKLVQLKIYEKPIPEDDGTQTVKAMLRELENILDIQIEGVNLNKKENMVKLLTSITEKIEQCQAPK
jgi:hypothetical protein